MSYAYGMKGAPAVGNGLGGLPRRLTTSGKASRPPLFRYNITRIVTPGDGVLIPPEGAKLMRVTVVGAGCYSNGGGGGCATIAVFVPVTPIEYNVGQGGQAYRDKKSPFSGSTPAADAEDTTASFANYLLTGEGGKSPTGGGASGGDFNFKGGDGTDFGGGGAAGPNGNGGNGASSSLAGGSPGEFSGESHGPGGGGGGASGGWGQNAGGGTGADGGSIEGGALGGINNAYSPSASIINFSNNTPEMSSFLAWGETPATRPIGDRQGRDGGVMGGGAGGQLDMNYTGGGMHGGPGGLVVEWVFY